MQDSEIARIAKELNMTEANVRRLAPLAERAMRSAPIIIDCLAGTEPDQVHNDEGY
jgi:glutamate racemase